MFYLPLSPLRAGSPSGVATVGSPSAVGGQEARGQLLPQTLPLMGTRYFITKQPHTPVDSSKTSYMSPVADRIKQD